MRSLIRGGSGRGPGRDLRADFFRGLALWFIFIDHIPGNWLGNFTLHNVALCDATEAFVLLAGYAGGLAYGAALDRKGWSFGAAALLRRAGTLYIAHIFLFVVVTAQVGYSAAALDSTAYLDELNLDPFGEQPYQALLQALMLRFQPAFLDILPLYIVLMLLLALALPLLRRPVLLLALSFAVYALVRLLDFNLTTWTGAGWFFNPLAWQLLFFIGCLLGYSRRHPGQAPADPRSVPFHAALATLCAAFLLLAFAAILLAWYRPDALAPLPEAVASVLASVDKSGEHPLRLISILALAYLFGHWIPRDAAWLRGHAAAPLLLMGQHGLPIFCAGIFLSFLGRLALEQWEGWGIQAAVNLAGFVAMVAIGAMAAWYRLRDRGEPAPAGIPGNQAQGSSALPASVPISKSLAE
ncbi:MAG: OpgC domain-containing protein [Acetobacteraceae bacterium]|nr:OpgC domain-containing protein [Acetobacteraceae bacterium]